MKIAVITLTRDRLEYTKHCFTALRAEAGCDYDHFVVDQASTDGTQEWLAEWGCEVYESPVNIGISRGFNLAIDELVNPGDYDVIVRMDNDCELTQPNTLRDIARLTDMGGALLSPRILGLNNPPQPSRTLRIGDEEILDIPQIGGIFIAAPAWIYEEFRYNEDNPYWGLDDVNLCAWFRSQGGTCGYVNRLEAWHYETSSGQEERYPDYHQRKRAEMLKGAAV